MNVDFQPVLNICPPAIEPFLEAEEAAPFLKISPRHLKKLAREGCVPAHPRGKGQRRRWLFLLSELDSWMRARVNSACDSCRGSESIQ
jgi:phage terminase Nu1 subunit (DNA packaging protein)